MKPIIPDKLHAGDNVRIIAPSRSLSIISPTVREIANKRLLDLGFNASFGKHTAEEDDFSSSSISSRVEDLHEAFADPNIKAIFSVIGGFNCNQLLRYINWDVIRQNPKVFIGYSDIAALNNAIFTKTGLVNYSGPAYSTFGQELYFDYTLEYFRKCVLSDHPVKIAPSDFWSDDPWYKDQQARTLNKNPGPVIINKGHASGTILGTNLCTFNLLQGTEYFPDLTDSILFLEDDDESKPYHFDRDLQSLIHLPGFENVKGLVIGRFQKVSHMTDDLLHQIIKSKYELAHLPVMANIDFGHTSPMVTLPIGGTCEIDTEQQSIVLTRH